MMPIVAILAMSLAAAFSDCMLARVMFSLSAFLFALPSLLFSKDPLHPKPRTSSDCRKIVELFSSWSWDIDSSGRFVRVSDGVKILGFHPDTLAGRLFYEICDEPNSCAEQFSMAIKSGMNMNIAMTVTVSGSKKYLQMVGTPVVSCGHVIGYNGVCIDSTDERVTYDRILYFQKMESIGTICAGITHDLKNMAQIISVNSYILKSKLKDEKDYKNFVEYLDSVEVSSTNLRNVLQKMVDVFAGSTMADSCSFVFDSFMEEKVIPMFITPSNIKLHVGLHCGPATVYGSPAQLTQMVLNLFINAYQAIDRVGEVSISTESSAKYVVLSIEDTGCGMTDEQMRRAFEAFYTCRQSKSGTGLGLFMVHEIAKNHGGYVTVSSKVGEGTTFKVFIPRCGA